MAKTKIPWCDYSINPIKGLCPVACKDNGGKEYCYARRMYKRFKWNPEIRFDDLWIPDLANIKKPSRIFVGSTMELFGEWVKYWWLKTVFDFTLLYPQHTFIFLTKCPQNLPRWSPFPPNCWVGVSVTSKGEMTRALTHLASVKATVRFLSIEPLLGNLGMYNYMNLKGIVDWIILGCETPVNPKTMCKESWVKEIIEAGIPVFIKPPLSDIMNLHRQEFPK